MTIVGGGSLILDGAANSASQTIVGSLSAVSSVTTPTLLEIGDISHPSAFLQGSVLVTPAGELRGHGTIFGNVTNVGTVFPGGSIGTLAIQGNYTQNADGTLAIEVTPTAYDILKVSGTAAIAGRLLVQVDPGASYVAGDQYQALQAAGGVTGAFSTTVYDPFPAYVTPTLTSNGNALHIRLYATSGATGRNADPAYLGGQIYADIPTALIGTTAQADALVLNHTENSSGAAIARTMLLSTDTVTAGQLARFSAPPTRYARQNESAGYQPHLWVQGAGGWRFYQCAGDASGFRI